VILVVSILASISILIIYILIKNIIIGGQILAKRLKKHVLKINVTDTAWDSYQGLEFYNFDHIGSHNEFKNHYRQRLDSAHVTQYVKGNTTAFLLL
jgi:heme oxygenase